MDNNPFITEIEGDIYLKPQYYDDRIVDLSEIFELYANPDFDAGQVARFVGIDESDVWNAVFYWSEDEEVYDNLVEEANLGPDSDVLSREQDEKFRTFFEDGYPESLDPLQTAVSKFMELRDREDTQISERNLVDFPDESYLGEEFDEHHISWTRDGRDLELYAGWDRSEQEEIAAISYSVEGEMGEILIVDEDNVADKVIEMYRNAVFSVYTK